MEQNYLSRMHLSFGMGLFWLFIAWAAGDTIVKTAQAFARRGSKKDLGVADLERRVAELEKRLLDQAELIEARDATIVRLEEKVEFTDRLLADRPKPRD
jgi:hypothetical protein